MSPYETDIRIPLYIRGPGIAPGVTLNEMVANIDVAPTLLELAGIPVPTIMDGQSLVPLLTGGSNATWRTRFTSEFAEGGYQTHVERAGQLSMSGGQSDFVWSSARTPRRVASYVQTS